MDNVRADYERWFTEHYSWEITRGRRGYKLTRETSGEYMWPIAADGWVVWQAAHNVYGEKK